MKLKLEVQNDVTFLVIQDYITPQHVSVLKAGLNRLMNEQNKKVLVLDFSLLPDSSFQPSTVTMDISGLQMWAAESGAQLLIISKIQGWGDAVDRNGVFATLNSPLGRLLSLENRLRLQVRVLEKSRAEIENKLTSLGISHDELNLLRRDNGHLKTRVADLEAQLRARLASRTNPFETSSTRAKVETAARILISILEKEGILPVA